jgi:ACS family glucarate transporter-like MFS transporter
MARSRTMSAAARRAEKRRAEGCQQIRQGSPQTDRVRCRGLKGHRRAQGHQATAAAACRITRAIELATRARVDIIVAPCLAPDASLPMSMTADFALRPTRVRYEIIALTCAMSVLLYLDRFCILPVTETMISELKLDRGQFGWEKLVFFWAYALMQVPSGWVCDWFGSRTALALYVVAWSLLTILLGLVTSLWLFLVLRLLTGMAQAGAYPAAASYIKKWIPLSGRARANSIVSMGGRAGGMLANVITPLLMVAVGALLGWTTGQWRVVFFLYGLAGLVWAVFFWRIFRERPQDHPRCNAAEVGLVEATSATAAPVPAARLAAGLLLHPNVLLLSVAGFFVNFGWVFLVSWMPSYLKDAYPAQLAEMATRVTRWNSDFWQSFGYPPSAEAVLEPHELLSGPLTALTGIAGICGCLTGGVLADYLRSRFGPVWGRRLPAMTAATIAACAYGLALGTEDVWAFVGLMALASFFIDVGLGALWATYQDFGGRYVASVLGFANMCGNLAAGLAGMIYGYLAKHQLWSALFLIAGTSLLLVACTWAFVDPRRQFTVGNEEGAR